MAQIALNQFQSVLATLTGEQDQIYTTPEGISTIVLSAQITNNSLVTQPVTIFVASNKELPVPNFDGIYSTGSFDSASALLTLNRQFIRKEVAAYTNYQNNLQETPFSFTSSRFEGYALSIVDAIAYDITNNKTIRTLKEANSFYTKNGVSNIISGEYSASINAIVYTNYLAQQIIKNQSVTGSVNVSRLYQTAVTQSFNPIYTTTGTKLSGSSFLIQSLSNVIKANIENPTLVAQSPVPLVTNVPIPAADSLSPVVAGKLVIQQTYGLVISGSPELSVVLSLLESANE
jgi:hypothetical protein